MSNPNAEFWNLAATYKRYLNLRLCLAEEPSQPCTSRIIEAHTIPRSQLKLISQDGHVYSFDFSFSRLSQSNGLAGVKRYGIGNFSTLNCFCATHDNQLFVDIEDQPLEFRPRQLALLHYRAVASELYKKIRSVAFNHGHFADFIRRTKSKSSIAIGEAFSEGEELAIRDARLDLEAISKILSEKSYDQLSGLVVRFRRPPSVMSVGGFYPEFDYDGRFVQRLDDKDVNYQPVSFNILMSNGGAAVILVWRASHALCSKFAASYAMQPTSLLSSLAIQTCFEHLENTCFAPVWWETLKSGVRDSLVRRFQASGDLFTKRNARCLEYTGVTYGDWGFQSVEWINCV